MSSTSSSAAAEADAMDAESTKDDLERIQTECSAMVQLLKNLADEEQNLDCQLKILAREALMCGFDPAVVEPPQPKRRRTAWNAKKKQPAAATEKSDTTTAAANDTAPAKSTLSKLAKAEATEKKAVPEEEDPDPADESTSLS
eukprot:scaffold22634_cov123-Cylindrotheca_fusiformis.AAC.14